MSKRRRQPMRLKLNPSPVPPTQHEIDAILLATDAIISLARRAGVVLILKGSRSQKALRWKWDELPEYGLLRDLTTAEIGQKVDWCIQQNWIRLECERDGIPLLFHTPWGWERVKELWVQRVLGWFEGWLAAGQPEQVWPRLEEIHRDIKLMTLDEIARRHDARFVPILRAWFPHKVRKVRSAINETLESLGQPRLSEPRDKGH